MILGLLFLIVTGNLQSLSFLNSSIILVTSIAMGFYWDSKRENFFWRGFITSITLGPVIAFIIGYLIDRVSFRIDGHKKPGSYTELMLAAESAKPDIINNIILGGAKVNKKTVTTKRNALMIAAESNKYYQVCELLIKAGTNIDEKDKDGMTALMWAAKSNNNHKVCRILIDAGANVNEQNNDGVTALMFAAKFNPNPKVIKTLLQSGANPRILDKNDSSVFDHAYQLPNKQFIDSEVYEQLRRVTLATPKIS